MSKKIYIPTTTLNFDNILSSESISPKSFYSNRGFGFSRWFNVDENNNDDVILLYDTPMGFFRPKSDIEDHPLLIEVTVDETVNSLFERISDGVYSYAKTIYIDPWNTYFIFQNERDKQTTLSLSDSSLETKVARLYSKRMIVKNFPGQYRPSRELIDHKLNTSAIKYDIATNKFKGFLYGYYVGAILSTSKSDVHQLVLLKELRNVIAAIISNINGQPSPYQAQMVISLTSDLNNYNQHRDALRQLISSDKEYSNVVKYLADNELVRDIFDGNSILKSLSSFDVNKNNGIRTVEFVNQTIDAFENKIEKKRSLLLPDCGEAIISEQRLMAINNNSFHSDIEKKIFFIWINEIFISSEYNGKISYYREALTDNLTVKAKNLLHEEWDSSEIKVVMNKLRRHLRGEEFDIKWNNGLISSLAAVITNGGDWGKMLSFMQQKGMNDYRLAFSMYGMLIGFANLTRDFTDIILNCDNKYVADVYKEFYGQLFGISVNIENATNQRKEDNITYNHISDIGKIPNDTTQSLNISQLELRTDNTTTTAVDIEVRQRLEVAIKSGVKADAKKGDAIIARWIANNRNWQSTIKGIESDEKLKLGKKTIKNICRAFNISMSQSSKSKALKNNNTIEEPSLFSGPPLLFYCDENAYNLIGSLLNKGEEEKQLKKDLEYLQTEYASGGKYSSKSKDNEKVIHHFEQLLWQGKNGSDKVEWKREAYKKLDIDRIISKLRSHYDG